MSCVVRQCQTLGVHVIQIPLVNVRQCRCRRMSPCLTTDHCEDEEEDEDEEEGEEEGEEGEEAEEEEGGGGGGGG